MNAPFERLNMKHFKARKPFDENDMGMEEPKYMKFLPRQNLSYYIVIELHNEKTDKIRFVSLKSREETEMFVDLFNLISSYR